MWVIHLFSNLKRRVSVGCIRKILPKKDGAEDPSDFCPISLIYGVAKIITKMMALRFAPFMHTIITKMMTSCGRSVTTQGGYNAPKCLPYFSSSILRMSLTP
jgi:hypothetical protein